MATSPRLTLAGRVPPTGMQLFAAANDGPRARRPTDVVLALLSVLLLIVAATLTSIAGDLDGALTDLLAMLPGFLDSMWRILFWLPVGWSVALLVAAMARRRRGLPRDLVAAAAVSVLIAALVGKLVTDDAWSVLRLFADSDGPAAYPPGALTLSVAVISTASPHLARPFRHFGRWLVTLQYLAAAFLGATAVSGAAAAVFVGLLAASIVHMVVGSPGGRPTAERIRLALDGLGVDVDDLVPSLMHKEGTFQFDATDAHGPLSVKVYGRDAWDGQLLANLWRLAWYHDSQRTARLSRLELVEHEGFVTLLAERAGVRVPTLVTAGSAGRGDALVVVRPDGVPLREWTGTAGEAAVTSLWQDLARLHRAGVVHGRIDFDRVVARDDGTMGFGDLASASLVQPRTVATRDQAQVLGLSVLLLGEERATATARQVLGDEALLNVLPYVQEAAMPRGVRDALQDADVELDDVRGRLGKVLGAPDQQLIRLRRVTWGSLLNMALLVIAAYVLIGMLGDIDMQSFVEELRDADVWWLLLTIVLAQIPRLPGAVSTMGSIATPLPIGPLTALQFAITYINLAIPSTAARVAVNIRFFERFGVRATTAVSAGVIDSVSGFVVQIFLFVSLFLLSDPDLDVSLDDAGDLGAATIILIAIVVVVVLFAVVLLVRPLRRRLLDAVHQARTALRVLRSPTKVLQLFLGNLLAQVLFAVALGAAVRAFGESVPLSELILINTAVSLFAGLLPIPGGIGVTEAGLAYGLTAAGLPSETALAIALAYRFASFYLPPIWGFFCYRWLVDKRYL